MDDTRELEVALAQAEQRVEAVRAARLEPLKQGLVEVERQLAEVEASNARLAAAPKSLPVSPRVLPLWVLAPTSLALGVLVASPGLTVDVFLGLGVVALVVAEWRRR